MKFIVNENRDPLLAGDVTWFENEISMLSYFEPWFANEAHLVFDEDLVAYKLVEARPGELSLVREVGNAVKHSIKSIIEHSSLPDAIKKDFTGS